MKAHAETDMRLNDSPIPKPFYRKLGFQIMVSLVLGIVVGFVFPKFGASLKVLGDIFLSLIKAGVAPLVFLTIVTGIASAGDVKSAGRVGLRAIIYFEVVSTIAIIIGLIAGNLMQISNDMGVTDRFVPDWNQDVPGFGERGSVRFHDHARL